MYIKSMTKMKTHRIKTPWEMWEEKDIKTSCWHTKHVVDPLLSHQIHPLCGGRILAKIAKRQQYIFFSDMWDKLLIDRTHDMEAHSLCSSYKARMTGLVGNKLFSSSSFLSSSRHTLVLMSQGLVNEFSPTFCINPSIKMSSIFFFTKSKCLLKYMKQAFPTTLPNRRSFFIDAKLKISNACECQHLIYPKWWTSYGFEHLLPGV